MLLSTHLIDEVERFVSRAVVLRNGRVLGDMNVLELEEQGLGLTEYIKDSYHYRPDRVSKALDKLTGQ